MVGGDSKYGGGQKIKVSLLARLLFFAVI